MLSLGLAQICLHLTEMEVTLIYISELFLDVKVFVERSLSGIIIPGPWLHDIHRKFTEASPIGWTKNGSS